MKHKLRLIFFIIIAIQTITACASNESTYHVGPIAGETILNDFKEFAKHKNDLSYTNSQLAELRAIATPITVKVFFGEWCHDSMREVPRLITLFEQVNNANIQVEYFGLDLKKSDPQGIALAHSIRRTPTVIVYRNGKELGRFLEYPLTDWANDIASLARQ